MHFICIHYVMKSIDSKLAENRRTAEDFNRERKRKNERKDFFFLLFCSFGFVWVHNLQKFRVKYSFPFFPSLPLSLNPLLPQKKLRFSQTAPTTTNETVALLDSLPSLSLSHSPHQPNPLSRYLVSLSNLPTLHAFQLKYLRNIQKVIEADEGPTVKGMKRERRGGGGGTGEKREKMS